jgi:hypothetical protein
MEGKWKVVSSSSDLPSGLRQKKHGHHDEGKGHGTGHDKHGDDD